MEERQATEGEGKRDRQGEEREEDVQVARGVMCAVKPKLGC